MKLSDIAADFAADPRVGALRKALSGHQIVTASSLAGSSAAVMLASLPAGKHPVIVAGDSADDAGYLYHDLCRLAGEEAVAILPSAYKRDIRYGQVDPPSQILRTEALSRWTNDSRLRFVITYPEAMAERVASATSISDHTLHLSTSPASSPCAAPSSTSSATATSSPTASTFSATTSTPYAPSTSRRSSR